MKCYTKYDYLAYLDGTLPEKEKKAYNLHFEKCVDCCNALLQMQELLNILNNQKQVRGNPFIYTRIQEKLTGMEGNPLKMKILKPPMLIGVVTIALFLGFALGNYLVQFSSNPNNVNALVWNELVQETIELTLIEE